MNKVKGAILAGGYGTRLKPLTLFDNKHLVEVGNNKMVYYPIKRLEQMGIKDIRIITGPEYAGDFCKYLSSFIFDEKNCVVKKKFSNLNFSVRVQEEAGGIPQAMALTQDFIDEGHLVCILGDNLHTKPINLNANKLEKDTAYCVITQVPDPNPFGVCKFDDKNNLIDIIEKPDKQGMKAPSNWIVTGCYVLPCPEAFEVIKKLKPSWRNELEIADLLNYFLKKGKLKAIKYDGKWLDMGSSLQHLQNAFTLSKEFKE